MKGVTEDVFAPSFSLKKPQETGDGRDESRISSPYFA
jgi:hypothetical protein